MDLTQLFAGNSSVSSRSQTYGNYSGDEYEEILKLMGNGSDITDLIDKIDVDNLDTALPGVNLTDYIDGDTIGRESELFYKWKYLLIDLDVNLVP